MTDPKIEEMKKKRREQVQNESISDFVSDVIDTISSFSSSSDCSSSSSDSGSCGGGD